MNPWDIQALVRSCGAGGTITAGTEAIGQGGFGRAASAELHPHIIDALPDVKHPAKPLHRFASFHPWPRTIRRDDRGDPAAALPLDTTVSCAAPRAEPQVVANLVGDRLEENGPRSGMRGIELQRFQSTHLRSADVADRDSANPGGP